MRLAIFRGQVLTVNHKPVITHFVSVTRQLFETTEGSYVYKMDEQKVYKLEPDSYTMLLLKLLRLQENHREYEENYV